MMHGQTELNMASLDSRRFGKWADREYCITKAIESYEVMYTEVASNENRHHGRVKRASLLFSLLNEKGQFIMLLPVMRNHFGLKQKKGNLNNLLG